MINRNNPHNYLKNRNRYCNNFQIRYNGNFNQFYNSRENWLPLIVRDFGPNASRWTQSSWTFCTVLNRFNFVKSTREATTINSCGAVWTFKANFWGLTPSWIGDHWYTRRRVNSSLLYPLCFSKKGRSFDERNYE